MIKVSQNRGIKARIARCSDTAQINMKPRHRPATFPIRTSAVPFRRKIFPLNPQRVHLAFGRRPSLPISRWLKAFYLQTIDTFLAQATGSQESSKPFSGISLTARILTGTLFPRSSLDTSPDIASLPPELNPENSENSKFHPSTMMRHGTGRAKQYVRMSDSMPLGG